MGFRSLPTLLIQTVNGLIATRPRVLQIDTTNLTLAQNTDNSLTLSASGGGSGATLDVTVYNDDHGSLADRSAVTWFGYGVAGDPAVGASAAADRPGAGSAFGILLETIAVGATGQCRVIGPVDGLDTSGLGDDAYADDAGALSTSGTSWLGTVLVNDPVDGVVFVGSNLTSVTLTPPTHTHTADRDGGELTTPVFNESAAPASPSAAHQALYFSSTTHHLTRKNSAGTVVDLEALGTYTEITTPATPGSGTQTLFIDSNDHLLKRVNSAGAVATIG